MPGELLGFSLAHHLVLREELVSTVYEGSDPW